jgi:hypothetical protein
MQKRAAKALKIKGYFARIFSLEGVPEHLRPLCLDLSRNVRVCEESGRIYVSLGGSPERWFEPSPKGIKLAEFYLKDLARNYLAKA